MLANNGLHTLKEKPRKFNSVLQMFYHSIIIPVNKKWSNRVY